MNELAKTYAEALFALALEEKKVDDFKKDIKVIEASFKDVEGAKKFFASVKISKADKKEVFSSNFKGKVNPEVINFLCLLVDRGRISHYADIFHEFIHLCNDELGIKEGIVETPRPISEDKIKELEKALSKDGVTVELKTKLNTTLISGFRVIFDDKIIDTSMKKKINQLNEMLLRKDVSLWN